MEQLELVKFTKLPSRRERIISFLSLDEHRHGLSCNDLCKKLEEQELEALDESARDRYRGSVSKYMNGSVSSTLRKLVKDGFLAYHPQAKSIRGGHIYVTNEVLNSLPY